MHVKNGRNIKKYSLVFGTNRNRYRARNWKAKLIKIDRGRFTELQVVTRQGVITTATYTRHTIDIVFETTSYVC